MGRLGVLFTLAILGAFSPLARSLAPSSAAEREVPRCIQLAAEGFGIDPLPLEILREVEGGRPGLESKNTNGTRDLGVMQINSSWLRTLASFGIDEADVRDSACINVYVAAWIFVQELNRTGDVVVAMARYHSPTPRHQARYLGLVQRVIERRLASTTQPGTAPRS